MRSLLPHDGNEEVLQDGHHWAYLEVQLMAVLGAALLREASVSPFGSSIS